MNSIHSPDGRLTVRLSLAPISPRLPDCVHLEAAYDGRPVLLPSVLGLRMVGSAASLLSHLRVTDVSHDEHSSLWRPVCGERAEVVDRYRAMTVSVEETILPRRRFRIAVRVYDEGLAFRYEFPADGGAASLVIGEELTRFALPEGCEGYVCRWAQGPYERLPILAIGDGAERPLTVVYPNGLFSAIGEAGNLDSARMKLRTARDDDGRPIGALQAELAGEIHADAPWASPWRFVLVGESPGQLLERNDLLQNLSPPPVLEDTSWVRPGKVIREITLSTPGGKACVDFAVQHNLQYIEYDAGWYGSEFNEHSDATAVSVDPGRVGKVPNHPGLDLQEVLNYARERGIGVWLYVNRRALERQLETIVPLFASWGVAGIKFGFVEVGPQGWTRWLHRAVELCGKHRLLVDIHDEYRPTGTTRTYPNLLTAEGIRGNEEFPSATHNVTLPFTRFLCGPGDYTICVFDPRLKTRRTHQLAMAAVYFSPLQFVFWYDRPDAFADEPEIRFLDEAPTTWDETRVLHGEVGECVSVARRKGDEWFVGTMTNESPRTLRLPLAFLPPGRAYTAHVFRDPGIDAPQNAVAIEEVDVDAESMIEAAMAASGGHCMRICPK